MKQKALGIDFLDQEGMKSFNKDKKKIKKWVKPYSILLASEELMKVTTKRMGRQLVKSGKFPLPIREGDSVESKLEELKKTVKF